MSLLSFTDHCVPTSVIETLQGNERLSKKLRVPFFPIYSCQPFSETVKRFPSGSLTATSD